MTIKELIELRGYDPDATITTGTAQTVRTASPRWYSV
jgi:hypothetical protein